MTPKIKSEEDESDPYCPECGGCGYAGCCGIRSFLKNHVERKTSCTEEEGFIADIISAVEYEEANHISLVAKMVAVLDKHCNWKPTEGYGSDEEKGYQKGLIAEAKLLKEEILSLLKQTK
jgi:hypothetical protein